MVIVFDDTKLAFFPSRRKKNLPRCRERFLYGCDALTGLSHVANFDGAIAVDCDYDNRTFGSLRADTDGVAVEVAAHERASPEVNRLNQMCAVCFRFLKADDDVARGGDGGTDAGRGLGRKQRAQGCRGVALIVPEVGSGALIDDALGVAAFAFEGCHGGAFVGKFHRTGEGAQEVDVGQRTVGFALCKRLLGLYGDVVGGQREHVAGDERGFFHLPAGIRALRAALSVGDVDAVGETDFMPGRHRLIDAIGVGIRVVGGAAGVGGAVVEYHVTRVVVLVKTFADVVKHHATVENHVVSALIATHFDAVAVAAALRPVFEDAVFKGPAAFERCGDVVGKTALAFDVLVPAVIAVAPRAAAVEVISGAVRDFHRETVGIAVVGVGVVIRVAVDHAVICREVFHLQSHHPPHRLRLGRHRGGGQGGRRHGVIRQAAGLNLVAMHMQEEPIHIIAALQVETITAGGGCVPQALIVSMPHM